MHSCVIIYIPRALPACCMCKITALVHMHYIPYGIRTCRGVFNNYNIRPENYVANLFCIFLIQDIIMNYYNA